MKQLMPVLFVSHGAPSLLVDRGPTTEFFENLGPTIKNPEFIVVVSAHWETDTLMVTSTEQPETIHDFYGFQQALYDIEYPCPGSPQLAGVVRQTLEKAGLDCHLDDARGLDHVSWVPLTLMFPAARIPVIQLSLQLNQTPAHHYRIGQALQKLREEGALIMPSGSATHNLREFPRFSLNSPPADYVLEFDQWMQHAIQHADTDALIHYRQTAPCAEINHPTEDHIMPLFVAQGATEEEKKGQQKQDR